MASKVAGNTGVRNELVSVCDELLRQNLIDKPRCKIIMRYFKRLITKRTYKKKYVIEGAGIFDFIRNFFARIFSSNAAKQLASAALQAGKTATNHIGMKAIDVDKTVAIDAGKKLVEKAAIKLSTPKLKVANVTVPPEEITKKVNEVIAKFVDPSAINLNKLIHGSSVNNTNACNAIAIQDLVRRLNGSGFENHIIFLSSFIKIDGRYIKIYRNPTY